MRSKTVSVAPAPKTARKPKRYEALAADIEASMHEGVLKPGDRLPSVREASRNRGVSPSTVFEAYYLLEARGLVRARPQSGYYVAPGVRPRAPEPRASPAPDGEARAVAVNELVFGILGSVGSRRVVPLGSAFPSPLLFPLPRLGRATAAALSQLDPWSTVDDLTSGNAALRQQIALRYRVDGVHVDPDEIVVTNGAMEALGLCLQAVCKPGDAVVVESPCFYACLQALERLGLHALEVATDPRTGIDLGSLESALQRHRPRACWVMTNFQNPLGSTMDAEGKRALVELLARYGVPLIEDDVYAELYHGTRRPVSTKAFDQAGGVMHCGSFSKSLAPGYRVGWAAPGRFRDKVARLKLTSSLATSLPAQLGLARYLERGGYERHLRALRASLRAQCEDYSEGVARFFPPGTRVSRPDGGYFLWIELRGGCDALALHAQTMAHGISIAPGPMFSASHGFRHCIRLNFGRPYTTRLEAALRTLGKLACR